MITHVSFKNFKALKDAELKLGAFNVIIGPNGSGKSSVLQGLEAMARPESVNLSQTITAGSPVRNLSITTNVAFENSQYNAKIGVSPDGPSVDYRRNSVGLTEPDKETELYREEVEKIARFLGGIEVFSLQAPLLSNPVDPSAYGVLKLDGSNLAGAISYLRDKDEDAYNQFRVEMRRWIPEYDSIGFDNDQNNHRKFSLRQKISRQMISATQVSEGTLLALALLTIVHQANPPVLIGLEEPDRGLHPRLLRELRDALYRLSFPSDFGINRAPVQVVITTHSPIFLDLFRDHPEQVIIANKNPDGTATFKNLSDDAQLLEIIGDSPLGEVWYSGLLGGVPVAA